MKRLLVAWCGVALIAASAGAQGTPDFSGLPQTQQPDLAAQVAALMKRVAELERRVDALEGGQAKLAGSEATKADPEAARLLAAAIAEKAKLAAHLDGFTMDDPKNPKHTHSRVKSSEKWDVVVKDAKSFAEALKSAVAHADGMGDGKASLEGLVKWARGRSVYQVKFVVNSQEQLILPDDFATDVVPADTK